MWETLFFRIQSYPVAESCRKSFGELGFLTLPCLYEFVVAIYCRSKSTLVCHGDDHRYENEKSQGQLSSSTSQADGFNITGRWVQHHRLTSSTSQADGEATENLRSRATTSTIVTARPFSARITVQPSRAEQLATALPLSGQDRCYCAVNDAGRD
ncbi:hypothetical protein J6590_071979 [Homalodisca vitripennis]|nr:hypothetical protein J6590_071979 [Homalodisca vitripennis]